MEEKLMKLQEKLQNDPTLGEKLFKLESAEEVQALLKEQELEFSLEEINTIKEALVKVIEKGQTGDELSEDELEGVAGGSATAVVAGIVAIGGLVIEAGKLVNESTRGRW